MGGNLNKKKDNNFQIGKFRLFSLARIENYGYKMNMKNIRIIVTDPEYNIGLYSTALLDKNSTSHRL